jgi:uncharacterized membrane protein
MTTGSGSFRRAHSALRARVDRLSAALAAVVFAAMSVYRHNRFASGGFDLGIFDQTIWGYSHFQVVANTIKGSPDLLGDHFHPILVLLAPAYWIWSDARVLLIAQALLIAFASLPIHWWARTRLGSRSAIFFQIAFLAFWGVLAGVLFDFHEYAVAVPALSFGTYALLEKRTRLFWAMFVVGCLTKEDVALTFAAMGVYALLVQGRRRFGTAVLLAAATWFAVTVEVIMPAISGHPYLYTGNYGRLGGTPGREVLTLLRQPYLVVMLLVDRSEKITTLVETFASWLFLPLVSPLLLLALPSLAERFWSTNQNFWSTSYHYSLPVAPLLAFAAIDGAQRLKPLIAARAHLIGPATLAAAIVLVGWVVRPLAPLVHYMSSARAAEIDACLDLIPASATVAASENLIPHLSHRRDIYRLGRRSAEYLALDTGARTHTGGAGTRRLASVAGHYVPVCRGGGIDVLRRLPRT